MKTWLHAENISTSHGFSTRYGGVSNYPFYSMNLGGSDDNPDTILDNRKIGLTYFGYSPNEVALLKQIHSNIVLQAKPGIQIGDALVTSQYKLPIVVSAADCYPILLYDEVNKIIGAAHAGWKGTLCRIVKNTIDEMVNLGANVNHIKVAIGQGISKYNYEVSPEIITQFTTFGFPNNCYNGRYLDLLEANRFVALECGIRLTNIWAMNKCTTSPEFFSYRRDKGITGRMWGLIAID